MKSVRMRQKQPKICKNNMEPKTKDVKRNSRQNKRNLIDETAEEAKEEARVNDVKNYTTSRNNYQINHNGRQ